MNPGYWPLGGEERSETVGRDRFQPHGEALFQTLQQFRRSKLRPVLTAVSSRSFCLAHTHLPAFLPDKLQLRCGCSLTKALKVCSPSAPQLCLTLTSSRCVWNRCRPAPLHTIFYLENPLFKPAPSPKTNSTHSSFTSSCRPSLMHNWR